MNDQELDNLLNDFLSSSDVPADKASNDTFVQSVMVSLPRESKLVWIRDAVPAALLFVAMLAVWKIKILTPAALWSLSTHGLSYLQSQWHMLSPTSVMALFGGALLLLCYYTYETISEI